MPLGALTPSPYQTTLDANGNPVSGAKINTYLAGTTTAVATYTDSLLTTPNANPIVADSSGRWTAWLSPGISYKFAITTSAGVAIRTVDDITAPAQAGAVDTQGVAGETIAAGQVVILGLGFGSTTVGKWYLADNDFYWLSTISVVGIALTAITNGATGSIRTAGVVSNLSGLSTGQSYYIDATPGAMIAQAFVEPRNYRLLGYALTTTSLFLIQTASEQWVDPHITNGRLTLTPGTSVTTTDVTSTTITFTPYKGNTIALFDSVYWHLYQLLELTIAVPNVASQMYDVFITGQTGTPTLELLAWTNDTNRATALASADGVWVKSGDVSKKFLGSFRTTAVAGQTEDSRAKRYVSNYYNRVRRNGRVVESTVSWNYTTATQRQANAAAANQLDFVICYPELLLTVELRAAVSSTAAATQVFVGIGEDVTNAFDATNLTGGSLYTPAANIACPITSHLEKYPTAGRHFYTWLEYSQAVGTTTWYSLNLTIANHTSGLQGWIEG